MTVSSTISVSREGSNSIHNGVVVHENVEVTGPTRAATYSDEKPLGPLMLQGDHGPVAYRSVVVRALPTP